MLWIWIDLAEKQPLRLEMSPFDSQEEVAAFSTGSGKSGAALERLSLKLHLFLHVWQNLSLIWTSFGELEVGNMSQNTEMFHLEGASSQLGCGKAESNVLSGNVFPLVAIDTSR